MTACDLCPGLGYLTRPRVGSFSSESPVSLYIPSLLPAPGPQSAREPYPARLARLGEQQKRRGCLSGPGKGGGGHDGGGGAQMEEPPAPVPRQPQTQQARVS